MQKKPFLTVFGHINRDIILRVPRIPQKGSINILEENVECGGTAYNLAIIAAKLSLPLNVYSMVGNDLKDCVDKLKDSGVDVSTVIFSTEKGPHIYILDDGKEQIGAIYQGPMENPRFNVSKIGEWTHFCTGPPEIYLEIAKNLNSNISFDPGQEVFYRYDEKILKEFLSLSTILFCNKWEYEYIKKIVGRIDVPVIVVTMGSEGCLLIEKGEKKKIPAIKVKSVRKSVGAGDSFRAGFYRGLYDGKNFFASCKMAVEVAAKYVEGSLDF